MKKLPLIAQSGKNVAVQGKPLPDHEDTLTHISNFDNYAIC
jgi:hypothetical protein